MKLQNILITGCSSGIGLETALFLQKNGIKVYASAREQKDVKMLEDLGLKAFKIDVRNKDEISFALNWILKEDKKLDCVFNNAGFAVPGAVEDINTDILKELFDTNFFGLHEVTTQAMRVFRDQGYGKIIQHSSVLGIISLRFRGAYNASKYAIEGLCDTLRLETLDSNIFISTINTGPVTSKFRENSLKNFKKHINIENSFWKSSYEKELKGFYPDLLQKSIETKNKDFFKLKDKEKLSLIKDYFNHDYVKVNPNNPIPYFMGIDCGLVNFASISIYNQHRDLNYVVSGRTLKNKIIKIDTKLDQKKSNLTTEEIKIIQSKKDNGQQLTRIELTQLKQFHRDLSSNKELIEFQLRKANITNDFVHKLSKGLIQDCLNKEIKVIIVGKNKGQKNEINLGSKTNRAMYNFPHARLIEILKYKAMLNDILVVETEESYTSKTSFIDNEDLAEYNKTTQGMKSQLSGKRIHQVFITKNKIKLHADINGSFNIVRKVLKSFQYDKEKMSLSYNLVELNLQGKNKFYAFCGPLAKSHSGFYQL